ncbi:hypothetical protein [Pistricoccus aurantiacus]|uniref:hypothetical protein n=1 Tax=Pistricoccus aurantiacus TaxID=1883414 RepID=UPI0036354017
MKRSQHNERLLAVIAFAAVLFTPPLILIFDQHAADTPSWLPMYLFIAWLAVIALVAWLMERPRDR